MTTMFEKVCIFNNAAGNIPNPDMSNRGVTKQLKLIHEELNELEVAIQDQNRTEARDAIADLLVVVMGMAYQLDINADEDFNAVHISNMSKFCDNLDEADATRDHYLDGGIVSEYRKSISGKIAVVSAADQHDYSGKHYPKGKVLKNVNYKKPVFA